MLRTRLLLTAGMLALAPACSEDENVDPAGAAELWRRVQAAPYRAWARPPGYETRAAGGGSHGTQVDIYVNDVVAATLGGVPRTAWPEGSVIVKDGYDGGSLSVVAAMEKRADGWFWAEWSPDGEAMYSGRPETCTGCHARGSDFVRAFALPR